MTLLLGKINEKLSGFLFFPMLEKTITKDHFAVLQIYELKSGGVLNCLFKAVSVLMVKLKKREKNGPLISFEKVLINMTLGY